MEFSDPRDEPYFFGRLLRSEAERILMTSLNVAQNGLFLLREKPQEIGTYVLSICFQDQIKHYKTIRLKNHNVKLDKGNEFIGPVELINYLRNHNCGLPTRLTIECPRHHYIEPVGYLFVDSTSLKNTIEEKIRHECNKPIEITNAFGKNYYIYEKQVLYSFHQSQTWFKKYLDSKNTEKHFIESGFIDGKFLLRQSRLRKYKLSVCFQNTIYHHEIEFDKDNKCFLKADRNDSEKRFEFILQLIDYHGREKGSLEHKLVMPLFGNETYDSNINHEQLLNFHGIYDLNDLRQPYIRFISRIAHGPISNIYHAIYNGNNIAVKFLKHYNDDNIDEMGILKRLQHDHIIKIVNIEFNVDIYKINNLTGRFGGRGGRGGGGENNGQNSFVRLGTGFNQENIRQIVLHLNSNNDIENNNEVRRYSYSFMEYSITGSLTKYLRRNVGAVQNSQIFEYTRQILSALEYLTTKNIIHRNVMARNVLLFENNIAKLSGFGLAKKTDDTPSLRTRTKYTLPLNWYPPESFQGIFSIKTDVWCFGVLLWETFSRGETPFRDKLSTIEDYLLFEDELKNGRLILERPVNCPDTMYDLMKLCWTLDHQKRPQLNVISDKFHEEFEGYISINTPL